MSADETSLSPGGIAREILRMGELLRTDRRAARRRLARVLGVLRASLLFRGCERGELVNALGFVRVVADGKVSVGDRVQFAGGMIPTELVCAKGGELLIGARCLLNYGVSVQATRSIRIGARCMFGSMTRIRDSDAGGASPIVIGDDVWLAYGVAIEPGVTIGEGSVVGAGSVVRSDVPPHSLASGNPALSVPLIGAPRGS